MNRNSNCWVSIQRENRGDSMKVKAVPEYCIGCGLCEIYCAANHDGYHGNVIKAFKRGNPVARSHLVRERRSWFNTCSHCSDAPCITGCISGAMQKDEQGIVFVDHERCVSCYTCVMLCPYGHARPDVHHGIVKCDLCRQEDGAPACVSHCPNEALVWEVE